MIEKVESTVWVDAKANAQLIAIAPEMFEQLKSIKAHIETLSREALGSARSDGWYYRDEMITRIDNLLERVNA